MSKNDNNARVTARLLTIPETASALRMSRSSIYQLIRNKHLEVIKIGRSTRVPAAAVDEIVELFRKCNAAGVM
ncbi:helix-turn-helix domain-containing protein [Bradyrhizobium murdochi]|uniref:helix-turn-helix domain-containing protein n=1 Tax=Bradyrhizobium murdochi TaxID=1038859 RepID=UPI000424822E|nr:helix-turn-helix domain-containing protein [Bradyrhizobium murdochi]